MKSYKAKQMISVMLLVGVFMTPTLTYADADTTAAVNALKGSNEGNFSQVNQNLGVLPDIKTNTQSMLDFMNLHMKNDEHLQALLNYEAAARMNEYQYNQQLLFMAAPGSIWAIQAGGVVGKSKVGDSALKLSNTSLLNALKPYSNANSFSGPLVGGAPATATDENSIPAGTTLTKSLVYDKLVAPYVNSGDTSGLTSLNLGQFMQTPNLTKGKITPAQSEQMIQLTLNPFPGVDPQLKAAMIVGKATAAAGGGGGLTGAASEAVVDALVENAIMSVSISALSDIVARRTPGTDSNGAMTQSVMEAMDNYSAQRFTNPAWYAQISASSDTAILREIAHMQAFNSWMQFQQFRVSEQQMALLATMNSVMSKMNAMMAQLDKTLKEASAKAQQAQAEAQAQADAQKAAQEKCGDNQYADVDGNCVDIPSTP
ncbi:MAG: hypothetical protein AB7V32_08330 [Candidatus Berkiella sp.]